MHLLAISGHRPSDQSNLIIVPVSVTQAVFFTSARNYVERANMSCTSCISETLFEKSLGTAQTGCVNKLSVVRLITDNGCTWLYSSGNINYKY